MKRLLAGLLLATACGGSTGSKAEPACAPDPLERCQQAWIHMAQYGCEPGASWIELDCPQAPVAVIECASTETACAAISGCLNSY